MQQPTIEELRVKRDSITASQSRIAKMHAMFGAYRGNETCGACTHFRRIQPGQNSYFKCALFGITHGPATDWRKSNPACGKFERAEQ